MKLLFVICLGLFVNAALANPCSVKISQNPDELTHKVEDAMDAKILKLKNLELSTERDAGSTNFDFTLEMSQPYKDSEGRKYIVMAVSSQKLLATNSYLHCNQVSSTFFSSYSQISKVPQLTAMNLIKRIPSCEILKSLEEEALKRVVCH